MNRNWNQTRQAWGAVMDDPKLERKCRTCGGSGKCPRCNGTGEGNMDTNYVCPNCNGNKICPTCDGSGQR